MNVMESKIAQHFYSEARKTPVSDRLHDALREPLMDYLPDDIQYSQCYDRFEYLMALVHADIRRSQGSVAWGPPGRFSSRRGEYNIAAEIEREVTDMGDSWPLIQCGLFDASVERLKSVKAEFDRITSERFY